MKLLPTIALVLTVIAPPALAAQGPAPLGFRASRSAPTTARSMPAIRRGSSVKRGALIGGLIGLGVGVLGVAAAGSDAGDGSVVLVIPAMAAIGAVLGGLIGLVVGRR